MSSSGGKQPIPIPAAAAGGGGVSGHTRSAVARRSGGSAQSANVNANGNLNSNANHPPQVRRSAGAAQSLSRTNSSLNNRNNPLPSPNHSLEKFPPSSVPSGNSSTGRDVGNEEVMTGQSTPDHRVSGNSTIAHQRGRNRAAGTTSRKSSQSTSPSKIRHNPICTLQRFCVLLLGAITFFAVMMVSVPGLVDDSLLAPEKGAEIPITTRFHTLGALASPLAQDEEAPAQQPVASEEEVPVPDEKEKVAEPIAVPESNGAEAGGEAEAAAPVRAAAAPAKAPASKFEQLVIDTKARDNKAIKHEEKSAKSSPTPAAPASPAKSKKIKETSPETSAPLLYPEAPAGNQTVFADQSVPHAGYFPALNTDTIAAVELPPPGVTTPVPVMHKVIYPLTSDGYPLINPPKSKFYSNFYCIGGRGKEGTAADRSCRFQNLCYKPSSDSWLYYQNPEEKDLAILLDHGKIVTTFPAQFLNLRSAGLEKDARYWSPSQVYQSIPEGAFVKRKDPRRADVHILYHPHYPSNMGHVVGDDFYPLFNLMQSFSMLTNDAQLILQRDCAAIFPDIPRKAELCQQMLTDLSPGMSQRPIISASDPKFIEKINAGKATKVEDLVCFENLLAGSGAWGFQQTLGKAATWYAYHHFYLANMGFNPDHTPKHHKITLSITDGKRSLFNNNELIAYVKEKFGSSVKDHQVVVEAVELSKLGGWQQELNYLLNTTVLITPWGDVSMSAMFLPHHSSLIVIDYYNTQKQNTMGMEEKFWTNLGYLRPFHYPFTADEVIMEEPGKKRDNMAAVRDWGRVKVELERMGLVLKSAIKHVDNFMTFGID